MQFTTLISVQTKNFIDLKFERWFPMQFTRFFVFKLNFSLIWGFKSDNFQMQSTAIFVFKLIFLNNP
jgi:hypothetical protein